MSASRKIFILLGALILLHWIVVAMFYFQIIHDPNHLAGTFRFHHGGDEKDYFQLAYSILQGKPIQSRMTLGYPLMLVPWILVSQAQQPDQIEQKIALLHALILFPIAQVLLFQITRQITRRTDIGLLAVLIWVLMPVGLYLGLAVTGRTSLGAIWSVHLIWAQMLTEPIATLLTLLSFWLLLRIVDKTLTASTVSSVLLGITSGVLFLTRMNGLLSISAIVIILMWLKRWRVLAITLICIGVIFIPQLIYNSTFFGNPFSTGYQELASPPTGLFNVMYVIEALNKYGIVIGLLGVFSTIFIGVGVYTLYQQSALGALIVGIWLISYLVFFSLYYFSWIGGFTRFLIPSYPALAILIASLLSYWLFPKIVR